MGLFALAACRTEVRSTVCRSLVVSSGALREAVCLLPAGITLTEVVDSSIFGIRQGTTLREKISSLANPNEYKQDGGTTWYVFNEPGRRLETACVPARDVDQDNLCFWHLRSQVLAGPVMNARLLKIVEEVVAAGLTQGKLSIVGPKRPDDSEESIEVVVRNGGPQSFDWYDPVGSKNLRTSWQR